MEEYRTMNIKPILLTAFFSISCILGTPLGLHADQVITLEQALDVALQKSPVLDDSRSQVAAADARLVQARSAYYPQLNATAGYDHTWSDSSGGSTTGSSGDNYDSYSVGISATQYLFDFGQTQGGH